MDALLLIDLQEDFLSTPRLAQVRPGLLRATRGWIALAQQHDVPIVEIRTVLPHDRDAWALNMRDDDSPVALEGTDGAGRVRELDDLEAQLVLKTRDDAFLGTDLERRLRDVRAERLVIAGVSTQACVALTAAGAYARDLRVSLADGAVASEDDAAHVRTLQWLADEYRQHLVRPDSVF